MVLSAQCSKDYDILELVGEGTSGYALLTSSILCHNNCNYNLLACYLQAGFQGYTQEYSGDSCFEGNVVVFDLHFELLLNIF